MIWLEAAISSLKVLLKILPEKISGNLENLRENVPVIPAECLEVLAAIR
jgi:hypothetical protein